MSNLFHFGDRISSKLQSLKHDGPFLSAQEIVDETGMVFKDEYDRIKLKEVILPSLDDREEDSFIDIGGIAVPTQAVYFHDWPKDCQEEDFEITFYAHVLGKRKEFWARLNKVENEHLVFFESVRDESLPWTDINLFPERVVADDVLETISTEVMKNIPSNSIYSIYQLKFNIPMVNYTFKNNKKAYTIFDIGCVCPLSKYLFNFFNAILIDNLYMLSNNSIKKLEMLRNPNLEQFMPNHDLEED